MKRHLSPLALELLTTIRAASLLHPGDSVGVAVSGGADSIALLHLLLELREKLGIILSVVHFNHQLRGKQSDADENFVANLAGKHKLPFNVGRENVAAKAKRERANLEDAARRARYSFFAQLVEREKLTKLAVAHTADDQAETVLAHILRGTGLAGLGGIHPTASHTVRPLLPIRRSALRAYLKNRKQTWREDPTNRDTTKLRARIRAKLLPLLQKQFQPAVVEHLATLAELAREDAAYLDIAAEIRAKALFQRNEDTASISTSDLLGYPKGSTKPVPVEFQLKIMSGTRRLVRHIVKELKTGAGELNAQHVQSIIDLAEHGKNGKSLPLPGGMEVRREHDKLTFRPKLTVSRENELLKEVPKKFEYPVDLSEKESVLEVPCLACIFRFTIIDWPPKRRETSTTGPVLDRRTLRLPLVLRSWRPGDQFRPSGHRKAHKLKRLLNEKRISRWEREGWPVLTSAGVIVWARGFPVAPEFAVTAETQEVLAITEHMAT